jgi:hypothetical protein
MSDEVFSTMKPLMEGPRSNLLHLALDQLHQQKEVTATNGQSNDRECRAVANAPRLQVGSWRFRWSPESVTS